MCTTSSPYSLYIDHFPSHTSSIGYAPAKKLEMSAPRSSSPTSSLPPTESTPANEPATASKTSLAYILTDENTYDEDVKHQDDEALDGNHLHNDHQHLYENYAEDAYAYGAHSNSEYDSRGRGRQGRQYAFAVPLMAQRVPRPSFPLEQPLMPAYAQIGSESWRGDEDAPPRKVSGTDAVVPPLFASMWMC